MPPKRTQMHWKAGRSAMELARVLDRKRAIVRATGIGGLACATSDDEGHRLRERHHDQHFNEWLRKCGGVRTGSPERLQMVSDGSRW